MEERIERVDRYRRDTYDVLYSSSINTYPSDIDVSRKYAKFLREHPEINEDEIDIHIESREEEEDHYGNGGGIYETMQIIKRRESTDNEYNKQVKDGEKKVVDFYIKKIGWLISEFNEYYCGYGYKDVDLDKYHKEVYEAIEKVAKEKLKIK